MKTERRSITRPVQWGSATQSNAIEVNDVAAVGVYLDGDFTGTMLTVQVDVSDDGDDAVWVNLYDASGSQVSHTVAANRVTALNIETFGYGRIRLVSDQSEIATGKLFAMS